MLFNFINPLKCNSEKFKKRTDFWETIKQNVYIYCFLGGGAYNFIKSYDKTCFLIIKIQFNN